ncbi:MAG: NAD(P)H-binding protein, partial [Bdellovibrionota bacterium]
MKIVVTGATGYIGGRLIPELLKKGHRVRVLVRDSRRIQGRPWTSQVEVFSGDLLGGEDLRKVFDGVDAAYYLIHSMRAGGHFEERDREAVRHFVAAARNVPLVIYLGGLIPEGKTSSAHLLSRAEVGRILRENLPTTEFRAGPIIGSGSASFEMIRYLTERLPLMTAPRWILNPIQPLAVRDVLQYLVSALDLPPSDIVELGSQALTFKEMLQEYAAVRGLRRLILPVPVLAPRLAGRWVGLVTPIPNSMALPLVEGILQPLLADT